jgi:phosphonate transport system substrate-binding protein
MASARPDWDPFIAVMSESLARPVEATFGPNYTVLVEAMRFNQTQAGWFGNASAMEAVDRSGGEVFAVFVRGGYHSVLISRKDRKITLDKVLACGGKHELGAGDPLSTSGSLAPNAWLFGPRNIDPAKCFKAVRPANHEANILAVSKGLTDFAFVDSTALRRIGERTPDVVAPLEVIWQSPLLPDDPLVRRADIDAATKAKLDAFVVGFGKGEGPRAERERAFLAVMHVSALAPATNEHLRTVRYLKAWSALSEARGGGDPAAIAAAEAEVARHEVKGAAPVAATAAPGQ